MCIAALVWKVIPDMPLGLLSNRDEFLARPTQALHQWQDAPILAGRDEKGGGTWFGLNPYTTPQNPRWALVLNFREGSDQKVEVANPVSRGSLVASYLSSSLSALRFARSIKLDDFEGFGLVLGDLHQAVVVSNRGQAPKHLANGLHVFSNGGLVDDQTMPWFKCESLRTKVCQEILPLMQYNASLAHWQNAAFAALKDHTQAPTSQLPNTGVSAQLERQLSSVYIPSARMSQNYGTRTSTLLGLYDSGRYAMTEKTHDDDSVAIFSTHY